MLVPIGVGQFGLSWTHWPQTDLKLPIGSEERCGASCSSEKDMSRLRRTSVLINKLVSHTKMIGFSLTLSWCHAKAASGNLRLQQHTQLVPCTCFGLRSVQLGRRGAVAAVVAAVSFEKAVPLLLQSDLLISARENFKEREFQRRKFQLLHYFNSLSECSSSQWRGDGKLSHSTNSRDSLSLNLYFCHELSVFVSFHVLERGEKTGQSHRAEPTW